MPEDPGNKQQAQRSSWSLRIGLALGALTLVLIALGLTVITLMKIPSGSMLPTIAVGERLLVNKLARESSRGDVVIFRSPDQREMLFAKRVVGRPGEMIELVGGRVVIDGTLVPRCTVGAISQGGMRGTVFVERLDGVLHLVLHDTVGADTPCQADGDCGAGQSCRGGICGLLQGPYRMAEGEVFVLGDNRDNSHDSRSFGDGLGAGVPLDDVIGRVWMRHGQLTLPEGADPALHEALAQCVQSLQ